MEIDQTCGYEFSELFGISEKCCLALGLCALAKISLFRPGSVCFSLVRWDQYIVVSTENQPPFSHFDSGFIFSLCIRCKAAFGAALVIWSDESDKNVTLVHLLAAELIGFGIACAKLFHSDAVVSVEALDGAICSLTVFP